MNLVKVFSPHYNRSRVGNGCPHAGRLGPARTPRGARLSFLITHIPHPRSRFPKHQVFQAESGFLKHHDVLAIVSSGLARGRLDRLLAGTALPTAEAGCACLYLCRLALVYSVVQQVAEKYSTIRNRITWERENGRGALRNWKNCSEHIWFGCHHHGVFWEWDTLTDQTTKSQNRGGRTSENRLLFE